IRDKLVTGVQTCALPISALYTYSDTPLDSSIQADPDAVLEALLGGRANRRQRAPRALERAQYEFEIVANFAAYRDLHRHRMLTRSEERRVGKECEARWSA